MQTLIEMLKVKPLMIICSESGTFDYYNYFNIIGYKMYYNENRLNKADGVVVYIKENIVKTTKMKIFDRLSIINTEMKVDKVKKLLILSVYRSHTLPATEFMKSRKLLKNQEKY